MRNPATSKQPKASFKRMYTNQLKSEIVKDFFSHDIIKLNTKEYFTLSSGLKLPIYLDHRRIFSFPELRKKVIQAWADMLKTKTQEIFQTNLNHNTKIVFSGTATAGIAPAYALSSHFEDGFIYVREKSKSHGLHSQIEGVITNDDKFIVVDDMVVTGSSLLKNGLLLAGLYGQKSILCATSISCHESKKMRQTFEQNGILFWPLFTTIEIFNIAHETNVIDASTFKILTECVMNQFDK
jgi:orotate phosphoribosyltransferase